MTNDLCAPIPQSPRTSLTLQPTAPCSLRSPHSPYPPHPTTLALTSAPHTHCRPAVAGALKTRWMVYDGCSRRCSLFNAITHIPAGHLICSETNTPPPFVVHPPKKSLPYPFLPVTPELCKCTALGNTRSVPRPPLAQARPRSQKTRQNSGSTPTPCLDKTVPVCGTHDGKHT